MENTLPLVREGQLRTRSLTVVVCVGAALALSGCDRIKQMAGGGGAPKGQVAATVNGEEITTLQLRAELGNFSSRDPAVMKAAQQQALQRIILRKLLAQQAREQKLDKTPDYAIQLERGEEGLLAQLYQRKLAAKAGVPTKQQAEAYITSHPEQFANRRVMVVDQLIAAPNKIPAERFKPLNSLGEVKALLEAEGVQYQESVATLDTMSANPGLVAGISKLPPGEVFVVPQGGSFVFNQITGSKTVPFQGDVATNYAMNVLRQQKAQETVGKQIQDMRKAAESKIVYNASFKPPPKAPAAKAAPSAAPAAAPAAPAAPAETPAAK